MWSLTCPEEERLSKWARKLPTWSASMAADAIVQRGQSVLHRPADPEQAISVLNAIDCKTLAQATLCANKEPDDYKVSFLIAVLEVWGHATVARGTGQGPATMALASAVRDR
eukprot:938426-Pyramimonas_sp.AAC.1